jgi:hypothetical protein
MAVGRGSSVRACIAGRSIFLGLVVLPLALAEGALEIKKVRANLVPSHAEFDGKC